MRNLHEGEGGVVMATSSFVEKIRENNPKVMVEYVAALEAAEEAPVAPMSEPTARRITDPAEIISVADGMSGPLTILRECIGQLPAKLSRVSNTVAFYRWFAGNLFWCLIRLRKTCALENKVWPLHV
jgi:hypothetical protein